MRPVKDKRRVEKTKQPASPLFTLEKYHRHLTEQDLLNDLKITAAKTGGLLSVSKYEQEGTFAACTIIKHFGTWNRALSMAGLPVVRMLKISDEDLFKNMETVWLALGRQPKFHEMRKPLSRFSAGPYERRFKTWGDALLCFTTYMNARNGRRASAKNKGKISTGAAPEQEPVIKHKTKRQPSERLKVQVLMRDGNKCRLCGETLTGRNIHFDHILPWCRGGETVLENLQVLCKKHNLVKGDL